MKVAVIGGGPAGAMAASRIAQTGARTILLDEKLAWEKPCGGGLTYRAYSRYPFLMENSARKRRIHRTVLAEPGTGTATMHLRQPLLVYSRVDLNQLLLSRAQSHGAEIEQERVHSIERRSDGWRVLTRHGTVEADYLIVATGARNPLRSFGTQWTAVDTMCALGYYLPQTQDHIDIQFYPGFEGYIWVFPRCDHLSVGICGRGMPASQMRKRLDNYLLERNLPTREAVFYGHLIPALESRSWPRNRIAGEGWMAVGDAAGLVDPVTGEGIYYAIRSGEVAAEALLDHGKTATAAHESYRARIDGEFMTDLAYGADLARRFFLEKVLSRPVPAKMIELMRRSPTMTEIVQDLFAGTQSYHGLKRRLIENLQGTAYEILMGSLLGNQIAREGERP